MFWKKKPKDETPKEDSKAAAARPEPVREERRPEPPREQPREQPRAPAPVASAPAATPRAAAPPAAGGDVRARVLAGLAARSGGLAAPDSPESERARAAAADSLLSDPNARQIVQLIAEEKSADAFALLERDAPAGGAAAWRRAGALMYGVDGPRALKAFEAAFAQDQTDFVGALLLARLRGMTANADGANLAAAAAVLAAKTIDERGVAHTDLALIAMARDDFSSAINHGKLAVEAQQSAITAGARDANALRDFIMRLSILADATVSSGAPSEARPYYEEALLGARKLANVDPSHVPLLRGVAELLEKAGATASSANDHAAAVKHADEAVQLRRRLFVGGSDASSERALASALNTQGEVRRLAGDTTGAFAAFQEALETARKASARNPLDVAAKREVWSVLWRVAVMEDSPARWRQVVEAMEMLATNGGLSPRDQAFYDEARKRAEQAA